MKEPLSNKVLKRVVKLGYKITKEGDVYNPQGELLNYTSLSRGYKRFTLTVNGIKTKVKFHRLQAYQKFGDKIFEDGIQVRHLNNDKEDNSWGNIEIGSQSQNMMDKPKEVRQRCAEHASSFIQKHNHEAIKDFYKNNDVSYSDIMKKFNISSKGTVSYIINKG